jgi:NADPH:quinone reductase-like Zn-dependent oxidoreductase
MKAGVASEKGIEVRDVPQPRPKPNEVLVKVRAASLNRADLTTARGLPTAATAASARRSASTGQARWSRPAPRFKAASSPATA